MRFQDYTPEIICRSLGLEGFEESWSRTRPRKTLRLRFCPAFDPEVCISFFEERQQVMASVIIARMHIWTISAPEKVAVESAKSPLTEITLPHLEAEFRTALARPKPDKVMLDGIRIHGLWRSPLTTIAVSENPAPSDPLGGFAAMVLDSVFRCTENAACKDGLAKIGRYLGLDLSPLASSR